ncbi:MAG: hypothetical protein HC921_18660 [Synechococcaceae cyanobacterium SM2_3_1]|nr:hypothetical protein [Synechococcaceae cyanobacterium SM2_3_1]
MTISDNLTQWYEANKTKPCDLCEKTDWCNISPDGNAIQCGRTDRNDPPIGWKFAKDGADGRPIFQKINDNSFSREINQTKLSETKSLEGKEYNRVRDLINKRGKSIPANAQITKTIYPYSEEQRLVRYDWEDPTKEREEIKPCSRAF